MRATAQVGQRFRPIFSPHNEVGLVSRAASPLRHGDKIQQIGVLEIGIAAKPSRIDTALQQETGDFLIGAALNQFDLTPHPARQGAPQAVNHRSIVVEKHRRQSKAKDGLRRRMTSDEDCKSRSDESAATD